MLFRSNTQSSFVIVFSPKRIKQFTIFLSQIIFDKVTIPNKRMIHKEELLELVRKENKWEVVLMLGAGDIDCLIEPVKQILEKKS